VFDCFGMGSSWSAQEEVLPGKTMPDFSNAIPVVDRLASTLAEKEAAFEMEFFVETCRLKELAADGSTLARLLRREDNTAFGPCRHEPCALPLDDEGFVMSFPVEDAAGIKAFFDCYGLVVVSGVLTDEACARSADEVWAHVERQCQGFDRSDHSTWHRWPSLARLGILGNGFLLSPQLCENRQAPDVHRAFAAVFGTEELVVNIGRASVMRPTRRVPMGRSADAEEAAYMDRPEWRSAEGADWLHWDLNPFTGAASTFSWKARDVFANRGYDRLHVQAILALSECGPDDGGFYCIPGSHRSLRSWANENGPSVPDSSIASPESSMQLMRRRRRFGAAASSSGMRCWHTATSRTTRSGRGWCSISKWRRRTIL